MSASHPIRLEGRIDTQLSRWLWLLKRVLVVPHIIAVAFWWIAFVVLSVVAVFSILFAERYPHRIFVSNLGVLRWTVRTPRERAAYGCC